MENDLIRRSTLQEALKISDRFMGCSECDSGGFLTMCNLLDAATAVDAVEVIRCKDCRFFSEFFYCSTKGNCLYKFVKGKADTYEVSRNDFCSFAKSKQ